ncbi:MAG: hypothetical protein FIA93_10845 [Deltaproteobacteria bacterium]|nr:hypothetical protein [Deltaproteobacteria bacterium]PWB67005.1 MAG: hypothetical protein C3F14_03190 [Deltaproteobacteria bacterium]
MTSPEDVNPNDVPPVAVAPTPLTREALYELVWSEPMLKVGPRYGVSGSYMARVCILLNVPRPPPGYWNKLAVGKAPAKPVLPDARPGDELVWSRDGDPIKVKRALPRPPTVGRRRRIIFPEPPSDEHSLVKGAKALFEAAPVSSDSGYLRPSKKLLVDLTVSKAGLDKALAFANQLFLTFELNGYRVVIAPREDHLHREEVDEREEPGGRQRYWHHWSPWRCTVVYVGTVAFGLSIIEMSEEAEVRYVNGEYVRESEYVAPKRRRYSLDRTWTTTREFPTGRLCLQAYSPYYRAKWVHRWREEKDRDLTGRIPGIVKELEKAAVEVARLVEEGERQAELEHKRWEEQHAKWERERAEQRAAEALKESKEELLRIIARWAEAKNLEHFFADAERRAEGLDADERSKMLDRLGRARQLMGSVDALERLRSWKSPEER